METQLAASVVDVDHPICSAVAEDHSMATAEQSKFDSEPTFHGFAAVCDTSILDGAGTPTITYGPGNLLVAHAINECVEIDEVLQAA